MDFLEKDLEDIIFEHIHNGELVNYGLEIPKMNWYERQFRIGDYGICDILSYSWEEKTLYLFELKKDYLDVDSLIQISRYATGIAHYLKVRNIKIHLKMMLIGRRIDKSDDSVYLYKFLPEDMLEIYTYHYGLGGLYFQKQEMSFTLKQPNF